MWKSVLIGAACAGVAAALGAIWFWPSISRGLTAKTTGSIYVSGPQVYTRERLVNDRYREDAWLLKELIDSPERSFGVTMSTSVAQADLAAIAATTGQSAPPATPDARKPDAPAVVAVEVSPHDRLNALRTYREQIRTQMIENQLDDRHDLRGNSLYRLRFDAAVLPGANTQTGARITVSVLPPENLLGPDDDTEKLDNPKLRKRTEKLDNPKLRKREEQLSHLAQLDDLSSAQRAVWDRVYSRWLELLGKRLEDSRKAVLRAYNSNQFTSYDYDRLLNSVKSDAQFIRSAIEVLKRDPRAGPALPLLSPEEKEMAETGLRDEMLEPRAESRSALETLRATTARNDAVRSDDLGHQSYKAEIDRLIELVNQGNALWSKFAFALQPGADSLETTQASGQAAGTPAGQPIEGCGDLKDYGTAKPTQATGQAYTLSLQYVLDREFEPKL